MRKKFIIALAASAAMLTGCLDIADFLPMGMEIEPPVRPVENYMPTVECTADEVRGTEWYPEMCEIFRGMNDKGVVHSRLRNGDVKNAMPAMTEDYPEMFWLGGRYYATTASEGSEIGISFIPDLDADDIPGMLRELEEAADTLIDSIPDGYSDYEKVVYVHDRIAENTEYDHEGADTESFGLWGSSYGCLVQGKAVCGGYSEAFQYIMNKLGIESGICTGSNHEWNYVKLDGKYYWLDITWDDGDISVIEHTYCLVDTPRLLRTRTFDTIQSDVPDCDSLDLNYYKVNGGFFETYDSEAVVRYIDSCSEDTHCEMMFDTFEVYEEALNGLFTAGDIRKAKAIGFDSFTYYRNDEMFTLDVIFR